jgi:iron complex transport system ATP-binding protein
MIMKTIETGLPWVRITVDEGVLVAESDMPLCCLSSAIENGGYHRTRHLLNMTVPSGYINEDPAEDIRAAAKRRGAFEPVGMMTAADVNKAVCHLDGEVLSIVTAGTSNAATPGESAPVWGAGTVNIFVVIAHPMTKGALANAIITVTEAKSLAFRSLDIRSTNAGGMATGTTTDSVAVCTTDGEQEPYRYASTATDVGRSIGRSVFAAVYNCLSTHNGTPADRSVLNRLRERGIGTGSLDDSTLSCCERAALTSLVACQDDPMFSSDAALLASHVFGLVSAVAGLEPELLEGEGPTFHSIARAVIRSIEAAKGCE